MVTVTEKILEGDSGCEVNGKAGLKNDAEGNTFYVTLKVTVNLTV